MKLLERAGVEYDTFAYSHSVYGSAELQHDLIGGLVDRCHPAGRHRGWVVDDAADAPVAGAYPERGIARIADCRTVPAAFRSGCEDYVAGRASTGSEDPLGVAG